MKDRNASRRNARKPATRTRTASGSARGKKKPAKSSRGKWIAAALIIGGLAFAAGWNPPSDTGVHEFTEASDYSAKRETGCTNSGDGCHGDDERRIDFNAYHPEVECKTCHEYTGVGCIPCHGPAQHECTGCHDGSMEGAGNAARLTKAYPKGHYRASLHEAVGTDMDQLVRTAAGGKAHAACGDCHSRDLMAAHTAVPEVEGSTYGTDIGCGECHNDKKSGALAQVEKKWKTHRCEDCHGESSQAPMHAIDVASKIEAEDPAGCGSTGAGCHENTDLHAMHANEPVTCAGSADDGEPGCHDLGLESHEPTVTACGTGDGSCHPEYENTEYAHENDASVHVPGSNAQRGAVWTDALSGVGSSCGACHSTDLAEEHNRAHSPIAGNACLGCHNANATTVAAVKDSWPSRDSSKACAACHGSIHGAVGTVHGATTYEDDGTASATACKDAGCHTSLDVRVLHAGVGCSIEGCHSGDGDINGANILSCGGTAAQAGTNCHTGNVHADIAIDHTGIQLDSAGNVSTTACVRSGCHGTPDLQTLHTTTGDCATAGCHAGDGPDSATCGGPAGTPGACHAGTDDWHNGQVSKHIGVEIGSNGAPKPGACTGSGCHSTVSLYTLHDTAGCNIAQCHDATGPSGVTGCGGPAGTPGSCHTGGEDWHYAFADTHVGIELDASGTPTPGACTASLCHATVSLYTLHREQGCAIPGCHGSTGTARCGGNAGTPNACHTSVGDGSTWHTTYAASHVGVELGSTGEPQPGACLGAGCHATTSLYSLHTSGCALTGCHSAEAILSCGGPAGTPLSCHTPPPPATCIVPPPPALLVAAWRVPHTDAATSGERTPGATITPGTTPWNNRLSRSTRATTPPTASEPSTATPPTAPDEKRQAPPRAPEKSPECTEESSVTIEATAICLECHDVSTAK
jgi:predicted CXXCH cytochrome family protein